MQSTMRLFADDSVIYRKICCQEDHLKLQQDMAVLADWSTKWLMHFNIKKCATLTITKKRKPSIFQYKILGEELAAVDQHEYLGVTVTHDLRWNSHHQKIINKASRTLGLLRRTLSHCTQTVKSTAYKTLVRPQVEYASEAWNPCTLDGQNRIEQIQRSAARFVFNDYRKTTSVTPLINNLGWESLHARRLLAQSTMFYKIHHGLVNITMPAIIVPATYFARRDHTFKYLIPDASNNSYKFSFYPRTVRVWNQLPSTAVHAPSVSVFQQVALPAIMVLRPLAGSRLL